MSEVQLNNAKYAGRPSMCRNCGALIGTDETSCSLCGSPKQSSATGQAQVPSQQDQDNETIRFARAILSRPYIFTIVFLIANIFVFFLTSQSGGNENAAVLIKYGAKVNALIDGQQEWWRFITPIFLHGNVAHLLMNMYGLWVIGPYVERLYGSAKFVFFWVATGIAGVVASYLSVQPNMHDSGPLGKFLFKAGDSISVGASGALFGLIGVLFVFGIKFRRELPEGFKRAFGTGMLPTILLNIFIGYMIPVIDNAAHMGGLVAGAFFALVVGYKRPGERGGIAIFWHILQVAAMALVIISFVMVARHFNRYDSSSLPATMNEQATAGDASGAIAHWNALGAGETAFVNAFNDGDVSGIDAALKQIDSAPRLDEKTENLRGELKSLLARVKSFVESKPEARKQAPARNKERQKLSTDFTAWQKKQLEWVSTDAESYGLKLQEPNTPQPDSSNTR
ncbi:MAG: rhomboid family intramembrane serine protease [Acidobacteria bacterium]|nr:rhomboid family intramembrane serine protease [Acidobacteriota bacterium]